MFLYFICPEQVAYYFRFVGK